VPVLYWAALGAPDQESESRRSYGVALGLFKGKLRQYQVYLFINSRVVIQVL